MTQFIKPETLWALSSLLLDLEKLAERLPEDEAKQQIQNQMDGLRDAMAVLKRADKLPMLLMRMSDSVLKNNDFRLEPDQSGMG